MSKSIGNINKNDRLLQENKQRDHKREYKDSIKQYVRKNGWVPAAKERLAKANKNGSKYLKYFTLCAGNAIDVLWFSRKEGLIYSNEIGFPEVVYCEHNPDEYENIARRLGRTVGYLAEIEDLILKNDPDNSEDFYSQLPFDVYNLDFSGVCFPRSEPPFSKTLKSIVTLIEVMGEQRYQHSFDIFFTFRANKTDENNEAIKELKGNLRENRKSFPEFNKLITQNYGNKLEGFEGHYHKFLLITLPKYLGRCACNLGFEVKVTHRYYYSRPNPEHANYHIISFGLSFEWVGGNTNLNKSLRQPVPNQEIRNQGYYSMMMGLVKEDICNVDAVRFERQQFLEEVQELLEAVEGE